MGFSREYQTNLFQGNTHNSKCRYGERSAADAKPKAQNNTGCCKGERRQLAKQPNRSRAAVAECEGLPPKHVRVDNPTLSHFGNANHRAAAARQLAPTRRELCGV